MPSTVNWGNVLKSLLKGNTECIIKGMRHEGREEGKEAVCTHEGEGKRQKMREDHKYSVFFLHIHSHRHRHRATIHTQRI